MLWDFNNFSAFALIPRSLTVWSLFLQYFQFPIWIANSHGNWVSIKKEKKRFAQDYCASSLSFFLARQSYLFFRLTLYLSMLVFSKQTFTIICQHCASFNTLPLFTGSKVCMTLFECVCINWRWFSTLFDADKGIFLLNSQCQHIVCSIADDPEAARKREKKRKSKKKSAKVYLFEFYRNAEEKKYADTHSSSFNVASVGQTSVKIQSIFIRKICTFYT